MLRIVENIYAEELVVSLVVVLIYVVVPELYIFAVD
jgi:F0F1-type ATP synthase membrane subunit a